MWNRFVLIVAGGCLLPSLAAADQVTLKNGDRLTGEIVEFAGATLRLKTAYAGEVEIQWEAIEALASEQPLHVTLSDERVLVGPVATRNGELRVQTAAEGETPVAREEVSALRSAEEQAAYESRVEKWTHPGLFDFWQGSFSAGVSSTSGNADATSFTLALKSSRSTQRDRISTYFTTLVARNRSDGETVTTANAVRGGARYDVNINNRLFTFAFTDLEFDEFQELDLRNVLGGGMGVHVLREGRARLQFFGGGTFIQEFFRTDLTRRSGEGLAGNEFNLRLSERTMLSQTAAYYPNLSEGGEFRATMDISAVTKLNSWLSWHVTASDRFVSNPLPGVRKNDVLLTTGLGVTFGEQSPQPTGLDTAERLRKRLK